MYGQISTIILFKKPYNKKIMEYHYYDCKLRGKKNNCTIQILNINFGLI